MKSKSEQLGTVRLGYAPDVSIQTKLISIACDGLIPFDASVQVPREIFNGWGVTDADGKIVQQDVLRIKLDEWIDQSLEKGTLKAFKRQMVTIVPIAPTERVIAPFEDA